MTFDDKRYHPRPERHPVRLVVRYENAQQFVEDYASDLSVGGMFVSGSSAAETPENEIIAVRVELPGYGVYEIRSRVVHRLSAEVAAPLGRSPGIGVQFVEPPEEFQEALFRYLLHLGQRKKHLVLVEPSCLAALGQSGFRVEALPAATQVMTRLQREPACSALVVPAEQREGYEAALRLAAPNVAVVSWAGELGPVMTQLDSVLLA